MEHPLDNPVWNALVSGNKQLAFGNDDVKYFDQEVSPFVAFSNNNPGNFSLLLEMLPHNGYALFFSPVEIEIPSSWKVLQAISGLQMLCNLDRRRDKVEMDLVDLNDQHAEEMVALAQLTNPGPFGLKTIDFGHYKGILDHGKLVAMAGQRFSAYHYSEISAVCTHPEYTGKGYARQLMLYQVDRIQKANAIPFLHVRSDNQTAIKVYQSVGFETRRQVYFYVMVKQG